MFLESAEFGNVSLDVVRRLRVLFKKLGWEIHGEESDEDDEEQLFDRFCTLMARLQPDEQELLFNLTAEFLHCPLSKYSPLIKRALREIDKAKIARCHEIFFLPLISRRHIGQVKSSTALMYQCMAEAVGKIDDFKGKSCKGYEDPNLLKRHPTRSDALILLCDDFIGTGETAKDAIDYYNENLRADSDMPVVVALVAQQLGADLVKGLGCDIAVTHIRKRGISDSDTLHVEAALKLMTKIEEKLRIEEKYRHGYMRSEALVSMLRTPDNTFPVFWCSECLDNSSWPAPFIRR
jgi:hypothetical protein